MAGKLTVVVGSMFSGKSSELVRQAKRNKFAGKFVVIAKPHIDTRYSEEEVVTHDQEAIPCLMIEDGFELFDLPDLPEVVLIDEVQFFDGALIMAIEELLYDGVDVVCFGLDMDRDGIPFGIVPYLMAIAETVVKLKAVCTDCGEDAYVSFGDFEADEQVVLGATEKYRPLCRTCFMSQKRK